MIELFTSQTQSPNTIQTKPPDAILSERNLTINDYKIKIKEAKEEINLLNFEIEESENDIRDLNLFIKNESESWKIKKEELKTNIDKSSEESRVINDDLEDKIQKSTKSLKEKNKKLKNVNDIAYNECSEESKYKDMDSKFKNVIKKKDSFNKKRLDHKNNYNKNIVSPWNKKKLAIDKEISKEENKFLKKEEECQVICSDTYNNNINSINITYPPPYENMEPLPSFPPGIDDIISQYRDDRDQICTDKINQIKEMLNPEIEKISLEIEKNNNLIETNNKNLEDLRKNQTNLENEYKEKKNSHDLKIIEFQEQLDDKNILRKKQLDIINNLNELITGVNKQINNYINARDTLQDLIKSENESIQRLAELGIEDSNENIELKVRRWEFIWNSFTPEERLKLNLPLEFDPLNIPDLNILENIENYNLNNISDLLNVKIDLSNLLGDAGEVDFSSFFPDIDISSNPPVIKDGEFYVSFGFGMKYSTLAIIIIVILIVAFIIYTKFFKSE